MEQQASLSGRIRGRGLAIVVLALFGLVFILAMISDFEGMSDVLSVLEGRAGHDSRWRLARARGGPDVDATFGGVAVDLGEVLLQELGLFEGGDVLLKLGDAAGPH